MKASNKCFEIVQHFESLHDGDLSIIGLQPKMDPRGIWTVGYGRALRDKNGKFLIGLASKQQAYAQYPCLTAQQALCMLKEDISVFEIEVYSALKRLGISPTQQQFDALVSLCYNCGLSAIIENSFPKAITRAIIDMDMFRIEAAFMLWVNSGCKKLPGLVARRQTEFYLYKTGEIKFFN